MKIQILLLVGLLAISAHLGQTSKKIEEKAQQKTVSKKTMRFIKTNEKQVSTKDDEVDVTKSSTTGGNGGDGDRVVCNVNIVKESGAVKVEKKMVQMKYLKGKLVMQGQVEDQGDKECELMDLNKCQSSSRNHLGKSIFFKSLNIGANKVRFSFNFFVGVSRELGMCSIRVAMKTAEDTFEAQEKVMSYFPQDLFSIKKLTDQKSFTMSDTVFDGKSTQEALEMCAQPLETDQKMFISNFYQTFEGFLLAESQNPKIILKCEKSKKMKVVLFKGQEGDLKKVDVFMDNQQYTKISIKGNSKQTVAIEEKKIDESLRGDNLAADSKVFGFKVYGQSYYNYNNNNCYDLDMKHTARSFTKSTFTSNYDNNVMFTFEAAAQAVESLQGVICAVYSVAQGLDGKYYVQNDLLLKFKMKDMSITNQGCTDALKKFNQNTETLEVFNSKDSRFLAGAVLNNMVNADSKLYCQIDISDNVSQDQFKVDQYSRIFYEDAVTQFVDNNNQDTINTAIAAQIEEARKRIQDFSSKENEVPMYAEVPFDMWTRKEVSDTLKAGSILNNNDFLRSNNGLFAAIIERNNNFVVYMKKDDKGGFTKMWQSNSANGDLGKGQLKLESGGVVEIVDSASSTSIFKTTVSNTGQDYFLIMQNDGNLVVYNNKNEAGWSTNTYQINNYFSLDTDVIPNSVENDFQHHFGLILRSTNKEYILQLDQSGSLETKKNTGVQADKSVGIITWDSQASSTDLEKFNINIKFSDGNLAQYKDKDQKTLVWQSNTAGKGGMTLKLTDEGKLEILDKDGKNIWQQTEMVDDIWTREVSDTLEAGSQLEFKHFIRSKNGRYLLIMQYDKDLVLYRKGGDDGSKTAIWSTKTSSSDESTCQMALDEKGVFTITDDISKKTLYTSVSKDSEPTPTGQKMVMQNDGNMVVYNSNMQPLFNTGTPDNDLFGTKQVLPSELAAPFSQYFGYILMSTNKQYMLTMSHKGSMTVLKVGTTPQESTVIYQNDIEGVDIKFLTMTLQLDTKGLLQWFKYDTTLGWSSNSGQTDENGYKLQLTDAGQLQVVDKTSKVIWDPSVLYTDIWASKTDTLSKGQTLANGQALVSRDNLYATVMMPDNSLVFYLKKDAEGTRKELKIIQPAGGIIGACVLKVDGAKLLIWDNINKKEVKIISNGNGNNLYLIQQMDGNLVYYNDAYSPVWNSGTVEDIYSLDTTVIPSEVQKGVEFHPGQTILRSEDKKSYIKYKWSGKITIFQQNQSNKEITTIKTEFKNNKDQYFILQNDGNLVFYKKKSKPTWASGTVDKGESMKLNNNGVLKIFNKNGNMKWSSDGRRFAKTYSNSTQYDQSKLQLESHKVNLIKK